MMRLLSLLCFVASMLAAQTTKIPLHGQWHFALDPVNVGISQEWFRPGFPTQQWDQVTVPHCYTVDPRYHYYTGPAWYLRSFKRTSPTDGSRVFIRFEAVFYRCQLWLNGKRVGEHEGGYTPFEFELTEFLAEENILALRVDNSWDTTTIPGAKTQVDYQSANFGQLYPWMNYGGITREVSLLVRPATYIENARIRATPNIAARTARLEVSTFVRNLSTAAWRATDLKVRVSQAGKEISLSWKRAGEDVAPGARGVLRMDAELSGDDLKLWSIDAPTLYELEVSCGKDVYRTTFGVRSIEIRGTKFFLNGEPLALGGGNRPLDHPGYGSMDPPEILEKDMRLMKSGGMEFSRISHYTVSTQVLDWADRHGMLIIAEPGNWQMTPAQMADPKMRAKFEAQMRATIERDWNHPSLIAWSVGNEYQSQTPEGKAWTKDMYAFVKTLDPDRFVTFASYMVFRDTIKARDDEASHYVDFISTNIYGNHLKLLQKIHQLYPDKPVYVSEFGIRADKVGDEQERIAYLRQAMAEFRQCDFVIGASVWTFNDYQSSFPGTAANGYRPWGLVTPERTPRAMYYAWQEEFCPATIAVEESKDARTLRIRLTSRKDFPSYILRGYKIRVNGQTFAIDSLAPGESREFAVELAKNTSAERVIELEKPGGFVIVKRTY